MELTIIMLKIIGLALFIMTAMMTTVIAYHKNMLFGIILLFLWFLIPAIAIDIGIVK